MKRKLKIIIFFLLSILLINPIISNIVVYGNEESTLRLDSANTDSLPDNFRKTSDLSNFKDKNINLSGLEDLNISGSHQFSVLSLLKFKKDIGSNVNIIDVDLREESHGFINGNAVSWYTKGNKDNSGLSLEEITKKENTYLASIPFGKEISLDKAKISLVPTVVENEDKLVTSNNIDYFRIPVTDGKRPTDLMVDKFMELVLNQPENTWIHFHCKHGRGRTTTFMVLYDIFKNSKNVSLEDIVERQRILGGSNLLEANNKRSEFIRNFYKYAKENNDDFKTTWTEWVKQNNITPYTLEDEVSK